MDAWGNIREAERLYQLARGEEPQQATITLQMALVQSVLAVAKNLAIEFDPTAVMDHAVTNIKAVQASRVKRGGDRVEWPPGRGAS